MLKSSRKKRKANYKSLPTEKRGFLNKFYSIILTIIPEKGLKTVPGHYLPQDKVSYAL